MKLFYELGYRFFRMPWEMGPREELVGLIESERIAPCRATECVKHLWTTLTGY